MCVCVTYIYKNGTCQYIKYLLLCKSICLEIQVELYAVREYKKILIEEAHIKLHEIRVTSEGHVVVNPSKENIKLINMMGLSRKKNSSEIKSKQILKSYHKYTSL